MRLFHPWTHFPVERQNIYYRKEITTKNNKPFVFIMENAPFPIIKKQNEVSVLFIMEPFEIKKEYDQQYIEQFDFIITYRNDLKHPNIITSWVPYPLFYRIKFKGNRIDDYSSFSQISAAKTILKLKNCSFLTSKKRLCKNHLLRLRLSNFLKKNCSSIDQYAGQVFLADKKTALDPYKYTIVIENHDHKDGFTEKIQDAFLAECMPFYWGCSNLEKYFPKNSFVRIPLENEKESLKIILAAIKKNIREKNIKSILAAKQKVLLQYNVYQACRAWEKKLQNRYAGRDQSIKKKHKVIWPESFFLSNGWRSSWCWLKNFVNWSRLRKSD